MPRASVVRLSLLAMVVCSACDSTPPPITFDAGPDAGPRDSGPIPDTGPPPDTGPAPDAGDAGEPAPDGGAPTCVADPERVYKLNAGDLGGDRAFGLAAGATSFGVVWTQVPEDAGLVQVHGMRVASDGTLGAARPLTSRAGQMSYPVVAPTGSSWAVAWVDNDPTTFEVHTMIASGDFSSSSTVQDVTATPAESEDNLVFLNGSDGLMLVWVEDARATLTRVARAVPIGSDGTPSGTAGSVSSAGERPGPLATGELEAGPVVIYGDGIGGTATVYLQGMTPAGARRGSRVQISTETNADGTVDAALLPTGGAVVFGVLVDGVRHEVRFRALAGDGSLVGDERIIANGTAGSIARFAGGYAVSYRAPEAGTDPAYIRLALVNSIGDVVSDIPVIQAPSEGGRTTVRVSGDGQIAIAWADTSGGGTDIRYASVTCGAAP